MAAFPSITPSNISLVAVNPTKIISTLNGLEQRGSSTGQYYRISATYSNLSKAELRQILGHVAQHSGPLDSFTYQLPDYLGDITGSAVSAVTVGTTAAAASSTTLNVTSGTTPYLKAGDLFKFATQDKIYQCIADATTTTLQFKPPARASVTAGTALTLANLSMTVRYATDNQEFAINTDHYSSISLEFLEVLS